jgi:hypothetical protein
MATAKYYSLAHFNELLFSNNNYSLPKDVIDTIKYLELNVDVPTEIATNTFSENKHNKEHFEQRKKDKKYENKKPNNMSAASAINENWKPAKTFKTTTINVKEGVDKDFNEIRISLNKMSAKNFVTQKNIILENISAFVVKYNTSNSEHNPECNPEHNPECNPEHNGECDSFKKIAQSIFDVAINNKFFSELYAELYAELSNKYNIFEKMLNEHIVKYKNTIHEINYVDPNVNYDEYCNYNKKNDARKASSTFFVMLLKKRILNDTQIMDIIQFYMDYCIKYIDEKDKLNEVEEITENLFILITLGKPYLSEHNLWNSYIIENVKKISKMKSNEHLSLSNRSIFKFLDIIENI